jgi:hypothetical protein
MSHTNRNGRWLLSFVKALEHTKRTEGCLVQVGCALTLEPCGPIAGRPRARVYLGVLKAVEQSTRCWTKT